jgi:hypothetical protein
LFRLVICAAHSVEVLREGGGDPTVVRLLAASANPREILRRLGVGQHEAGLKILCSEEFLVEDWPLLEYHTLRHPASILSHLY